MGLPVLACGTYVLNLQCPECGCVVEVAIHLDTRLTMDSSGASLAAKLGSKAVDHLCGQLRLITANGKTAPENGEGIGLFTSPAPVTSQPGDMT
jgi:hypothetical protein